MGADQVKRAGSSARGCGMHAAAMPGAAYPSRCRQHGCIALQLGAAASNAVCCCSGSTAMPMLHGPLDPRCMSHASLSAGARPISAMCVAQTSLHSAATSTPTFADAAAPATADISSGLGRAAMHAAEGSTRRTHMGGVPWPVCQRRALKHSCVIIMCHGTMYSRLFWLCW